MTRAQLMSVLERALDDAVALTSDRVDAFDLRAETKETRSVSVARGAVRSAKQSRAQGLGVRVWVEGAEGFASSHDLSEQAIGEAVEAALRVARANARAENASFPYVDLGGGRFEHRPALRQDPTDASIPEIVGMLERCTDASTEEDPEAKPSASFATEHRRVLYADASGRRGDCAYVSSTLAALVVRREAGRTGSGVAFLGGERGLAELGQGGIPEEIGVAATRDAIEAVAAKPAPAGRQRLLCDNVLSGLLAHESFGHLIEIDVVEMDWSLLKGRMGERFADESVSVVDAPQAPGDPRDGVRIPYDQEGVRGREVRILDDGVLNEFLHLRGSAAEAGVEPTGNGRTLDSRFPPIARMRNTYFEPGDLTLEEALERLDDGVYLVGSRGGAPASDGTFMFTCQKGYRVRKGEVAEPLRSTSIAGNILDFLENITGVTDDFAISTSNFGGCGKWGQSFIPIGKGGPHLLVEEALVGGETA